MKSVIFNAIHWKFRFFIYFCLLLFGGIISRSTFTKCMKCIIVQCCIPLYLREPSHGSYATVFLFQFIFYEFHAGPTFFLGYGKWSTSTHLCNLALLLNYYDRLISHCDVSSTAAVSLVYMSKTPVEYCFHFFPHICCCFCWTHASFQPNGIVSSCQKDAQGAAAGLKAGALKDCFY